MRPSKTGILFAMPLAAREYLTGRVLLDLDDCYSRGLMPANSGADAQARGLLIEIFSDIHEAPAATISDVLLPQLVVSPRVLEESIWPEVGANYPHMDEFDFPVTHLHSMGHDVICRGDVKLPVGLDSDWFRAHADRARPGIMGANIPVYGALYALDRISDLPEGRIRKDDRASLSRKDLRCQDEFDYVLDQIDIDRELRWDESYYDFALYHGWDTRRFFVDLTDGGDIVLCPYCQTTMSPDEHDCPHCERDTTKDAPIQLTPEQYCHTCEADRESCTHCGAQLLEGSLACWSCTEWQS